MFTVTHHVTRQASEAFDSSVVAFLPRVEDNPMWEDASFLAAISATPDDVDLRMVYADWLEEGGDVRGEFLRLLCALATLPRRPTRKRKAFEARFAELRPGIDPSWRLSVALVLDRDAWREVLSHHNQALGTIRWYDAAVRRKPIGVWRDAQAALLKLLLAYEAATDAERRELRELVAEFDTFFAATYPPKGDTATETIRRQLIQFALIDQYPDPRDAVLWLQRMSENPVVPLQEFANLRREVAPMASSKNRYGFGSTRSLLLRGYAGGYGQRGAPDRAR
jgi:uncharacterized protein (TIGR02996 family)